MPTSEQHGDRRVALVTGSHGLSGRAVYEHLHGRPGWEVIGASRRAEPLHFPGTATSARSLIQVTDARLLGPGR
jgi:uncharacterized protein YbjT (DUF2867 family)